MTTKDNHIDEVIESVTDALKHLAAAAIAHGAAITATRQARNHRETR